MKRTRNTSLLSTREFLRQSRHRLKVSGTSPSKHDIKIYVSPTKNSSSSPKEKPKRFSGEYITISCARGQEFVVPVEVALHSSWIRRLLAGSGVFRENIERKVHVEHFSPAVVEKVFQFCFQDHVLNYDVTCPSLVSTPRRLRNPGVRRRLFTEDLCENACSFDKANSIGSSNPSFTLRHNHRVVFAFEISPDSVMELLMASHYLGVLGLVDVTCRMLADNVESIPSFVGLPSEVIMQVLQHLTPMKLLDIESSGLLNGLNDVHTEQLWRSALEDKVEKDGWEIAHCFYELSWLHRLEAERVPLQRLQLNFIAHPHVRTNIWRHKYIQCYMRWSLENYLRMSDDACWDPLLAMENEAYVDLQEDIERCGPWVTCIAIPHSLNTCQEQIWDSIEDFVSRFQNLRYLCISNRVVGECQLERLFSLLAGQSCPALECLKMSRAGIDDLKVHHLLKALALNCTLQHIDLSENSISSEGLKWFPLLLKGNKTLRSLSLACNVLDSDSDPHNTPVRSLFELLYRQSNLRLLDVGHNRLHFENLSEDCWTWLRKSHLTTILWNDNRADPSYSSFGKFVDSLPSTLMHLSLRNCRIGSDHIHVLQAYLTQNTTLISLDLSDNVLGSQSAAKLARILSKNQSLESLNLGDNYLWDNGGSILCDGLRSNCTLRHLNLERNGLRSAALVIAECVVSRYAQLPLESIVLDNNHIPLEHFKLIKQMLDSVPTELVLEIC